MFSSTRLYGAALACALVLTPLDHDGSASAGMMPDDPSAPVYETAHWPKQLPEMRKLRQRREGEPTVSCLPDKLKQRIAEIERRWGTVRIMSTHRPGARVRDTGRPSRHASCQAVDFRPPRGSFELVASWLKSKHDGGVGTYARGHIHIDTGPRYRWHN